MKNASLSVASSLTWTTAPGALADISPASRGSGHIDTTSSGMAGETVHIDLRTRLSDLIDDEITLFLEYWSSPFSVGIQRRHDRESFSESRR